MAATAVSWPVIGDTVQASLVSSVAMPGLCGQAPRDSAVGSMAFFFVSPKWARQVFALCVQAAFRGGWLACRFAAGFGTL